MCANFKPLTLAQLEHAGLPSIPFEYPEEVYPSHELPLLFKSNVGLEWRKVHFGLIPKWAEDKAIGLKTYNARSETLQQKASFKDALSKFQFGVIPVYEFYESKYIDGHPQRWGIRRKDGKVIFIAALYEVTRLADQVVRSATMLTMDAINHPMMREFHEPGQIKRSVIVISHQHLQQWLSLKSSNIHSFIEGFPVEEFECSHVPKRKVEKESPQLNFFDV